MAAGQGNVHAVPVADDEHVPPGNVTLAMHTTSDSAADVLDAVPVAPCLDSLFFPLYSEAPVPVRGRRHVVDVAALFGEGGANN